MKKVKCSPISSNVNFFDMPKTVAGMSYAETVRFFQVRQLVPITLQAIKDDQDNQLFNPSTLITLFLN